MDAQCDKCGEQLPLAPQEGPSVEEEVAVGFHVVIGGDNVILSDGDSEWEPDLEYDLCPRCKEQFLEVWKKWFGVL